MRIAFHCALILSILFCPWWTGAIIMIAACFLLDRFYESVIYGIAVDALYGSSFGIHGFVYTGTVFCVAVFLSASFIRTRLAWQ